MLCTLVLCLSAVSLASTAAVSDNHGLLREQLPGLAQAFPLEHESLMEMESAIDKRVEGAIDGFSMQLRRAGFDRDTAERAAIVEAFLTDFLHVIDNLRLQFNGMWSAMTTNLVTVDKEMQFSGNRTLMMNAKEEVDAAWKNAIDLLRPLEAEWRTFLTHQIDLIKEAVLQQNSGHEKSRNAASLDNSHQLIKAVHANIQNNRNKFTDCLTRLENQVIHILNDNFFDDLKFNRLAKAYGSSIDALKMDIAEKMSMVAYDDYLLEKISQRLEKNIDLYKKNMKTSLSLE